MYETSLLYDEKRTTEKQNVKGCVSFDNCMLDLQRNVGSILLPKVALLPVMNMLNVTKLISYIFLIHFTYCMSTNKIE